MSDRKDALEAELALIGLQEKYDAATERFREHPTDSNKRKFKDAKQAFVDARQAQRRAGGRSETAGIDGGGE